MSCRERSSRWNVITDRSPTRSETQVFWETSGKTGSLNAFLDSEDQFFLDSCLEHHANGANSAVTYHQCLVASATSVDTNEVDHGLIKLEVVYGGFISCRTLQRTWNTRNRRNSALIHGEDQHLN